MCPFLLSFLSFTLLTSVSCAGDIYFQLVLKNITFCFVQYVIDRLLFRVGWRECFVVLDDGADSERIEKEIKEMPNYFEPYNTVVHFISEQELTEKHNSMPHGGFVLRSGNTSTETNQIAEFSLKLDSNPEFTASVLVSYARAVYRMRQQGSTGAITVLDVPVSLLSTKTTEELLKENL